MAPQDELLGLQRQTGATVIFITNDLDEALYLGDRMWLISGAPGTITYERSLDLPRRRHQITTREQPEFLKVRHVLGEALENSTTQEVG
ncbi:hypothetical protein [Pseudonocardia sp.]|uniref:hypothetical protein n=1 Tax=Pseudonocardia sp. TaxID=60912 RepID=UPI0031FDCA78